MASVREEVGTEGFHRREEDWNAWCAVPVSRKHHVERRDVQGCRAHVDQGVKSIVDLGRPQIAGYLRDELGDDTGFCFESGVEVAPVPRGADDRRVEIVTAREPPRSACHVSEALDDQGVFMRLGWTTDVQLPSQSTVRQLAPDLGMPVQERPRIADDLGQISQCSARTRGARSLLYEGELQVALPFAVDEPFPAELTARSPTHETRYDPAPYRGSVTGHGRPIHGHHVRTCAQSDFGECGAEIDTDPDRQGGAAVGLGVLQGPADLSPIWHGQGSRGVDLRPERRGRRDWCRGDGLPPGLSVGRYGRTLWSGLSEDGVRVGQRSAGASLRCVWIGGPRYRCPSNGTGRSISTGRRVTPVWCRAAVGRGTSQPRLGWLEIDLRRLLPVLLGRVPILHCALDGA